MRGSILLVCAFGAVGCLRADVPNGALKCSSDPNRRCPEGYFCAPDDTCWKNDSMTGPSTSVVKQQGQPCALAGECSTGYCVDGFCCDSACSGQCQACDVGGGVCTTIVGAPHGSRTPCRSAGYAQCASACTGDQTSGCVYPGSVRLCGAQTCSGGILKSATVCDGAGSCVPVSGMLTTPCPAPPNATATCAGAQCDFVCNAPYQRVGSTCVMPGSGDMG